MTGVGIRLVVAEDYEAFSAAAADLVTACLKAAMAESRGQDRRPCVTFPTGETPQGLYSLLAADAEACRLLRRARFFQLDEYLGASADDEVSFFRWLRQMLFDPVGIPPEQIHRLPADDPEPQLALGQYEAALRAHGGLDLAVLGLGLNGHLGFNEPGTPFEAPSRIVRLREDTLRVNRRYWHDQAGIPPYGMTLGLGVLLAARKVILMAAGAAKAEVLARALNGPLTPELPASALRHAADVTVVADRAAAQALAASGSFR